MLPEIPWILAIEFPLLYASSFNNFYLLIRQPVQLVHQLVNGCIRCLNLPDRRS